MSLRLTLVALLLVSGSSGLPLNISAQTNAPFFTSPKPLPTTSVDRNEKLRNGRIFGWGNGQAHGGSTLLRHGDASLLEPIYSAYLTDFRSHFEARMSRESIAETNRPLVIQEVLQSLSLTLIAQGEVKTGERLSTLRNFLHQFPDFDNDRELSADDIIRQKNFFAELPNLPRAYSFYLRSLAEPTPLALNTINELLALPSTEQFPLTALAQYRRARLTLSLTDWDQIDDPTAKARLHQLRQDLRAVPISLKQGAQDFGEISAHCEGWIAYSYSMVLPAKRLLALGEADFPGALATYLRMPERGEANGANSAFHLIAKLNEEAAFASCTQDPDLRFLMTIYQSAAGWYGDNSFGYRQPDDVSDSIGIRGWLKALAADKIDASFAPQRIAMLQLIVADYAGCQETLKSISPTDPLAALLRSRCNLHLTGDKAISIQLLRAALGQLPSGPDSRAVTFSYGKLNADLNHAAQINNRVGNELAMLLLSQGNYDEALRLFYDYDNPYDATYIAECILSIGELKDLVDRHHMGDQKYGTKYDYSLPLSFVTISLPLSNAVRRLLARRLFRADRWEESLAYFPSDLAKLAQQYSDYRKLAARTDRPDRERAEAYWRAACLMNKHGQDLMFCTFGLNKTEAPRFGSKPEPSTLDCIQKGNGWHVYSKDFIPLNRLGRTTEPKLVQTLSGPLNDEKVRVDAWLKLHIEQPTYSDRDARYETFRLTLLASKHLPANDPAGAMILQFAGNLLKYRDPQAANPAYRALVLRFPKTPLGAHAAKNHWFSPERTSPSDNVIR